MTIDEAKAKTTNMQIHLRAIYDILLDCCILPQQVELLDNFRTDILSFADAEISHQMHLDVMEQYKESK